MENISKATAVMPSVDAEEFMALLLSAQSTKHNCPYCVYFKKAEQAKLKEFSSLQLIGSKRMSLDRLRVGATVLA